jgi:hypothetical protein
MKCPLMGKFKYVDHMPETQNAAATFGSCVHAALEHYHKYFNVSAAELLFTDLWENPEKINATPDTWPQRTSFGGYRNKGIDMIRGYHEKHKWENLDVLGIEQSFVVPCGEYDVNGFIDLLALRKSGKGKQTLLVTDLKTGRRPTIAALKINIQMTLYHYAVQQKEFWLGTDDEPGVPNGEYWWEMLKGIPIRVIWYDLKQQKEVDAGPREPFDYMRMYRAMQMIDKATETGVYVPNISGDSCTFCSFTEQCGVKVDSNPPNDSEAWF